MGTDMRGVKSARQEIKLRQIAIKLIDIVYKDMSFRYSGKELIDYTQAFCLQYDCGLEIQK